MLKKEKEQTFIDTRIDNYVVDNIFLGFEDKQPKKEKIIEKALTGNFVMMDGERIEIDDSEIFGAEGKMKNEDKLDLNNGFVLTHNKFSFSNKEFKKEKNEEDGEECFEFNKLERRPSPTFKRDSNRSYKKKSTGWGGKPVGYEEFDLSEYEVFGNSDSSKVRVKIETNKTKKKSFFKKQSKGFGWKSKKMNVPKFDLSEYEVFSNK